MRILDEEIEGKWSWTGSIDITTAGDINLLARSVDKSQARFLKIKINPSAAVNYIEIEEQPPHETSLRVQNDLEDIDLVFYQTCSKASDGFKITSGKSLPYAWQTPSLTREIYVDFQYKNKINYHSIQNKYSFDWLNKVVESVFVMPNQQEMKIHSITEIRGKTRIMRFYHQEKEKKRKNEEIAIQAFQIKLKGIGLSLISSIEGKKVEIIYASLRDIEFATLRTNLMQAYQLRIKYINIDNNAYSATLFPVLLTPTNPRELLNPDSKNYFIDILIKKNLDAHEVNKSKSLNNQINCRSPTTIQCGLCSVPYQFALMVH